MGGEQEGGSHLLFGSLNIGCLTLGMMWGLQCLGEQVEFSPRSSGQPGSVEESSVPHGIPDLLVQGDKQGVLRIKQLCIS